MEKGLLLGGLEKRGGGGRLLGRRVCRGGLEFGYGDLFFLSHPLNCPYGLGPLTQTGHG